MKLNIVIFCLVLSLPVLLNATSVFSTEFKAELKKTSFGKSIMGLEQLAAKFGTKGIYDSLYQAIDDLIAKLQSQLANENNSYNDQVSAHQTLAAQLQASINQYTETFAAQQIVFNNAYAQAGTLTALINELNDQIQNNQALISSQTEARQAESAANQQRMSDLNDAINAAHQAVYMLEGLKNQNPTLIQTKSQMKTTTENLKQSLKKVAKKMFYKVLIQALEEQNFANQDILNQIIDMLNNLINTFSTDFNNLQTYEQNAEASFQEAINALNAAIDTAQSSLVDLGAQLDQANADMQSSTDIMNDSQTNLTNLNEQLNTENSNFASATQSHDDLVAEIQKEIAIAQQAEAYLQQNLTEVTLNE